MEIKPIRNKWKGTMTDRERFHNQMHYKPVDRCFNMEFGYWDENFEQWQMFRENGIKNNEEADIFSNLTGCLQSAERVFYGRRSKKRQYLKQKRQKL